jgi:hypothetical protein
VLHRAGNNDYKTYYKTHTSQSRYFCLPSDMPIDSFTKPPMTASWWLGSNGYMTIGGWDASADSGRQQLAIVQIRVNCCTVGYTVFAVNCTWSMPVRCTWSR